MMRMRFDLGMMRGIIPARDEMIRFVKPIVTVLDQFAINQDFGHAQITAIHKQQLGFVLLDAFAYTMINRNNINDDATIARIERLVHLVDSIFLSAFIARSARSNTRVQKNQS
jgi:hypothetical protein